MASAFVFTEGGDMDHHHDFPRHRHTDSRRNSFKSTWSTNKQMPAPAPPSCGIGGPRQAGEALPKCVCAPATHAGSFKCRLHRANSRGHTALHSPPSLVPESTAGTINAR